MKGLARRETSKNEIPIFSRVSFDKRCSKLVHNYLDRTPLPPFDFTNRGCTNIWNFFLKPENHSQQESDTELFFNHFRIHCYFFALLTISSTLWGCKEEAPLKGSIKPSSCSREKMDLGPDHVQLTKVNWRLKVNWKEFMKKSFQIFPIHFTSSESCVLSKLNCK